jgi:hypothetical protein
MSSTSQRIARVMRDPLEDGDAPAAEAASVHRRVAGVSR